MVQSWVELVIGDLDEKRVWRRFKKRMNALPKDYRFTYKKILGYFYHFGYQQAMLSGLLELFEESAAEGKPVLAVVGSDAAAFCDELIQASGAADGDPRERLNREIREHFHREEE